MVEKIIKISPDDIPEKPNKKIVTEFDVVRRLGRGKAIKFPCRWNHTKTLCGSMTSIRSIFEIRRWKGNWICKDKWVYIHRFEFRYYPSREIWFSPLDKELLTVDLTESEVGAKVIKKKEER